MYSLITARTLIFMYLSLDDESLAKLTMHGAPSMVTMHKVKYLINTQVYDTHSTMI